MPRLKSSEPNKKKVYRLNQSELESIVIDYVARTLEMKPPFVHTIAKDLTKNELVITLEQVANVMRFPQTNGGR